MRIVAGKYKGRTIAAPKGDSTRPTTDRVREALMSSLVSLRGGLEGAIVLDAFAGSGALGLEALSRGAARAVFYERDRAACAVVRENVCSLQIGPGAADVCMRDVMKAPVAVSGRPFDMVFLDPPYALDACEVLVMVARLVASGAVEKDAIVVYEHALDNRKDVSAAASRTGFEVTAMKKYGKTGVSILVPKSTAIIEKSSNEESEQQ